MFNNLICLATRNFAKLVCLSVDKMVEIFDENPSNQFRITDVVDRYTEDVNSKDLLTIGLEVHLFCDVIGMFSLKNCALTYFIVLTKAELINEHFSISMNIKSSLQHFSNNVSHISNNIFKFTNIILRTKITLEFENYFSILYIF